MKKEDIGDNVNREELLIYLKQQKKDLKSYKKKNSKLEERYLLMFKENKSYQKSWNIFFKIFEKELKNQNIKIDTSTIKSVEFENKLSKFYDSIISHKNFAIQSKEKIKNSENLQIKYTNLQKELSNTKQALFTKNDLIKELKSKIEKQERETFDNLINDLKEISSNKRNLEMEIAESDKTSKIIELKSKIKELEKNLDKFLKYSETDQKDEIKKKIEIGIQVKINKNNKNNDSWEENEIIQKSPNLEKNTFEIKEGNDRKIKIYLKDLLNRYFQYEIENNVNNQLLILNVIFDVLDYSYDERQKFNSYLKKKKRKLFPF